MTAPPPTPSDVSDASDGGAPGLANRLLLCLRERIVHWRYPPGHRFTEDDLCREFGVSRSPVREALKVLVANGFVEQLPRRGYAVRQLDLRELDELYEVRLALESLVVERLASRDIPGAGLDAARADWERLVEAPAGLSSEALARLDEDFHEGLARVHGNATLLARLGTINERLLIFRMMDFESPERTEETCRQHLAVIDRIAAGDGAGARAAVERNILDGRSIVETAIADALARAYLEPTRNSATASRG